MENNKTKITYTKAEIIKRVAKSIKVRRSLVKKVYNGVEEEITKLLASANNNEDISLRLFDGLSIDSKFLPEKEKVNNLTGETITTLEKIRAKANITKHYCNKLSNYNNGNENHE